MAAVAVAATTAAVAPVKPRPKVLVVIGCTGAGKSKLAIELAQRYTTAALAANTPQAPTAITSDAAGSSASVGNGEVLSADSIQVYHGLDIASNKVTADELRACGVPHHLISVVDATAQPYDVLRFRDAARALIADCVARRVLPVVCGGTFYWIEALLWRNAILTAANPTATTSAAAPAAATAAATSTATNDSKQPLQVAATAAATTTPAASTTAATAPAAAASQTGTIVSSAALPAATPSASSDATASAPATAATAIVGGAEPQRKKPKRDHPSAAVAAAEQARQQKRAASHALYAQLMRIDPAMAQRLHPNDDRKIARALELAAAPTPDGAKPSERWHAQRQAEARDVAAAAAGDAAAAAAASEYDVCVLWVDCDWKVLSARLGERIDAMVARGLLAEVEHMWTLLRASTSTAARAADGSVAWTKGIGQSLGIKEFAPYLNLKYPSATPAATATTNASASTTAAPAAGAGAAQLAAVLQRCITSLKTSTVQYAKKQLSWIRKRFVSRALSGALHLYRFDATAPARWDATVRDPAFAVCDAFMFGAQPLPIDPKALSAGFDPDTIRKAKIGVAAGPSAAGGATTGTTAAASASGDVQCLGSDPLAWRKFECKECERTLNGEHEYREHLASRKHQNRTANANRKRKNMAARDAALARTATNSNAAGAAPARVSAVTFAATATPTTTPATATAAAAEPPTPPLS